MTAAPLALPWLRVPPIGFRDRLRAMAREAGPVLAADLVDMANHALDLDTLLALDRTVAKCAGRIETSADRRPAETVRLAVLAEGSMEYTCPALRATGLRRGLKIETWMPAYGQTTAVLMDPDSDLRRFAPDAALLAATPDSLGLTRPTTDAARADAVVTEALGITRRQAEALQRMGAGIVIVQTLVQDPLGWAGHLDATLPGAPRGQIAAYNAGLADLARDLALVLLDAAALAARAGEAVWADAALWHRAKVPMALDAIPLYADHVVRLLAAARGRSAKCLVLDLDNTCWGGVIGDDGPDGIRIGQGSAEGEAFLAIQHYALALKARGIVLAVCSKNEEATARAPFESHPDMALKLEDIAVFVANWTDKATNIAAIARTLNIGIDALAFLDDNPAERERVRQSCPEVMVPEVGDDPALYPALLAQSGYFETLALTADDANRADQYRANALRADQVAQIGNYDEYLASLGMTCDIRPFDATGRARIAQLIAKSNQFNLTTRRYSEADVAAMEADPDVLGLQVRLADRFGDNGMISVVIFRKGAGEWICDTWLMSCRVLKRRVEEAILDAVAVAARAVGVKRLVGDYLPSAKNAMVAGHFEALGFARAGTPEAAGDAAMDAEATRWVLDLADYSPTAPPMTVDISALCPAGDI